MPLVFQKDSLQAQLIQALESFDELAHNKPFQQLIAKLKDSTIPNEYTLDVLKFIYLLLSQYPIKDDRKLLPLKTLCQKVVKHELSSLSPENTPVRPSSRKKG